MALADRLGDVVHVVGNFGDQDHVGAAGDARAQRQPAGAVAHDLDHDDAVVAVRRAVQAVDRLGGDAQRGVEAEGDVGHRHVVVDGLGQRDDVEALLHQAAGVLLRAAAAQADQRVEVVFAVVVDDQRRSCPAVLPPIGIRCGLSRLVPRIVPPMVRMPDSAAPVQLHGAVFHQAAKAVAKADDVHAVGAAARPCRRREWRRSGRGCRRPPSGCRCVLP